MDTPTLLAAPPRLAPPPPHPPPAPPAPLQAGGPRPTPHPHQACLPPHGSSRQPPPGWAAYPPQPWCRWAPPRSTRATAASCQQPSSDVVASLRSSSPRSGALPLRRAPPPPPPAWQLPLPPPAWRPPLRPAPPNASPPAGVASLPRAPHTRASPPPTSAETAQTRAPHHPPPCNTRRPACRMWWPSASRYPTGSTLATPLSWEGRAS
mmetsp:Transcript_1129/g.2341  ORF Transcript_1129/g.2341 Transcript_1129/m.2341 type:complete len:208 (-) Transcript_1129:665-1288(-)